MTTKNSIAVTIPATTAQRQFGDLIRRTYSGKEHFIVEKDGLPVVVILSLAEYEQLMSEHKERRRRLNIFQSSARTIGEEVERQGLSEEEMEAELEESKRQVYEKHYGSSSNWGKTISD
ncbi:MAG: type II toxin-antitoxin system prevent-host-death family antitoxin [Anaerolineae bacterium]